MNVMMYKNYTAAIEYSEEDGCLIGRLQGIRDIVSFHGDSVEAIRAAFEEAVDFYLESCAKAVKEPQKPYSGRIILRMPPELHAELDVRARMNGKSLNAWLVGALNDSLHSHP
ncbi:type II toxin-antitoxin system HicB family antitoxin [Desulfomicrobium orale]|uniref:DNA repair protein n=1 Tax=Desulfomicrobium orale DSM 12838 TaxID=888061 RepID=A0A0X8JRY6_9BACT|nr:type II toxin-antitoxin system HicB family antitoxin [Desulfomicrobium orale]AMD93819.1 DNA repair protein [Desulfomicrobium orale DSM 12838]